jgi:hypothetical protein
MNPEDEMSEPAPVHTNSDAALFETALQVEGPDDGAIDNPNAET